MVSKLIEKIQKTKAPICVGLDPMLGYIPEHVKEKAFAEFGETLEGAAEAIWQFNCAIVDATAQLNWRHQARRHRFHIGCLRNRSSRQREGWKYDLFRVQYRVCDGQSVSGNRRRETICGRVQRIRPRYLCTGKDF